MKAYLITADECDYDEYDSCVIVAETPKRALEIAEEQIFKAYQNLEIEELDLSEEKIIIDSFNAG